MIVGVTGASSGIGARVIRALRLQGHTAITLGRHAGAEERPYDLGRPVDDAAVRGLDAVIHLAWSWSESRPGSSFNVDAGTALAEACGREGVRPVLLSTFSAFSAATSQYGASKAAVEDAVTRVGGTSLRAGLIWGGSPSGIVATLATLASVPLLRPRLLPDPTMRHSERDALAAALVSAADPQSAPGTRLAASHEGVRLSSLLDALRGTRRGVPLPVPVRPVRFAASAAERLRIPLPFRADSLAALAPSPDVAAPLALGWEEGFPGTGALLEWAASR